MPHFSQCCPNRDTYICQQCGSTQCSGCKPSTWTTVPRSGHQGNLCPTCAAGEDRADADAMLVAQRLFGHQYQIYDDACDIGVRIDENSPTSPGGRARLRAGVRALIAQHKPTISKWHDGRTYDFGNFEISYCRDRSRRLEFLSYNPK